MLFPNVFSCFYFWFLRKMYIFLLNYVEIIIFFHFLCKNYLWYFLVLCMSLVRFCKLCIICSKILYVTCKFSLVLLYFYRNFACNHTQVNKYFHVVSDLWLFLLLYFYELSSMNIFFLNFYMICARFYYLDVCFCLMFCLCLCLIVMYFVIYFRNLVCFLE